MFVFDLFFLALCVDIEFKKRNFCSFICGCVELANKYF